ncbi:MAG: RHS repeat-associated core domain-containing protein, partial [Dolichospermum sp.]
MNINYSWVRGFTGHEHLDEFGLINMNNRLYDPVIARMLSVDNFVQNSTLKGYNRFTYALNNPLKYTDPSGEWVQMVLGGIMGGVSGYSIGKASGHSIGDGLLAYTLGGIAIGSISGGLGSIVGGAISNEGF